jgi:ubiquinone/menaquinone biosynthesis C-methylase UbiE
MAIDRMTEHQHSDPVEQAPFDEVAARYDSDFTDTPLGQRQRLIVHRYLSQIVQPRYRVLELNCGTGQDALWLARHAGEVVATDISEGMLDIARRKAMLHPEGATITFRQLDINRLRSTDIAAELGTFDLILSDFDGLNCLSDISWLPDALRRLLNPGGHVVLVFMNPLCAMESLYFIGTGRFGRAFARLNRDGVSAHIGNDVHVRTYFHPVGRVAGSLRSHYAIRRIEAVGLSTPPTLMRSFYHRHEGWFRRLFWLEDQLAQRFPFNRIGDHVLIHAQLKDA